MFKRLLDKFITVLFFPVTLFIYILSYFWKQIQEAWEAGQYD